MSTPTPEQVREALDFLAPPGAIYTADRAGKVAAARATLESALAPPPVEGGLLCSGCGEQPVGAALCGPCSVLAAKADRAAAENRGFREAADWLDANKSVSPFDGVIRWGPQRHSIPSLAIYAEADRREGRE